MASLAITPALLARAARRNGYAVPAKGLVFFGIRGLSPDEPFANDLASSRAGTFSPVDFKRMSCSLGQWAVEESKIALFPGSTVPSLPNIVRARANAGSGTNMLMLGRYEHEKGVHKAGKPGGHRAFRQAAFFPVWRTVDDLDYDLADRLDLGSGPGSFVWDNLHSSYAAGPDDPYSSAGCQVVCGLPRSPSRNDSPETGPWRSFVERGYATDQSRFVYLLFAAEELALIDRSSEADLTQVVRFGSTGRAAELVQRGLKAKGFLEAEPDGDFLRKSLDALVRFQAQALSPAVADGICGAATAAALGVTLPPLAGAGEAPGATTPQPAPVGDTPDPEDESDLPANEIRPLLVALGLLRPQAAAEPPVAAAGPPPGTAPEPARLSRRNFERCQAIVKDYEGGFSNDPQDPGGATNFGITLATLAAWRKRAVTPAEVRAMTYDEAKEIYFSEYWNRSSCGAMPGPLALAVYNIAVHAGLGTAARFLQRGLNANGASVAVDGGIGGETLGAIPSAPLPDLVSDVIDLYEEKLRAHRNFAHFKRGFLARVAKLRAETERWLDETAAARPSMPTPKVDEEDDPAMETQINTFLTDLLRGLTQRPGPAPAAPVGPVAAPGQVGGVAPAELLAQILRALQIVPGPQPPPPKPDPAAGLTPVNAALGVGMGTMLDGKKSAIGIIGSLLTWVLEPGNPLGGAVLAAIGPAGPAVAATAQTLLPFFLALGSWGVLGKFDKYAHGITVPTPEKRQT